MTGVDLALMSRMTWGLRCSGARQGFLEWPRGLQCPWAPNPSYHLRHKGREANSGSSSRPALHFVNRIFSHPPHRLSFLLLCFLPPFQYHPLWNCHVGLPEGLPFGLFFVSGPRARAGPAALAQPTCCRKMTRTTQHNQLQEKAVVHRTCTYPLART